MIKSALWSERFPCYEKTQKKLQIISECDTIDFTLLTIAKKVGNQLRKTRRIRILYQGESFTG